MMPLFVFMAGQAPNATLSAGDGGTISVADGSGSPWNSYVAIRFLPDGTVEVSEVISGGSVIGGMTSHGVWITPDDFITGNEQVRYTNRVQTAAETGTADFTTGEAEDSWVDIADTPLWQMNKTTFGVYTFTCDFEVRETGRTTGSTAYSFGIANET